MNTRVSFTCARHGAMILFACASLFIFTGCVTPDGSDPMARSEDGDIPWNQPQPWEGTIPMPTPGSGGGF